MSKFYQIAIKDFKKQPFDLSTLKGKVVICVNVASLCGLSVQYKGLETLYQKYKDAGLEILGFPSNDFFQEPLDSSITASYYGVSFPIMERVHVNGSHEHEVYKFLKAGKPGVLGLQMVKWNFEKFMLDREGNVVERFMPTTTPEAMEPRIVEELG
ncbi:peroxiredoxin HYR1 [Chytridium lagenaria]|nr:peroxiredoxin HYR1 [Chytridium lagenaria]